jgi:hypothetical protein
VPTTLMTSYFPGASYGGEEPTQLLLFITVFIITLL